MPPLLRGRAIALALGLALPWPHRLAAQSTAPPLALFEHTSWQGTNGPGVTVGWVAKSPDGYIWLGTTDALLRFDGVRFTTIDSLTTPLLHSRKGGFFLPRQVDTDGSLEIELPDQSIVGYKGGAFRQLHAAEADVGATLVIDGAGQHWLTSRNGTLHRLNQGRAEPARLPSGVPDTGLRSVVRDTGSGLWIGTNSEGLWHVVGERATRIRGVTGRVQPLIQGSDGTLWLASGPLLGLSRLVDGRLQPPGLLWDRTAVTYVLMATTDRFHSIWFATLGHGVLRWRDGGFQQFGRDQGLSDITAQALVPDDAGGVWVTTSEGLDRLRQTPLVTIGKAQGLPWDPPSTLVEDAQGGMWGAGLNSLGFALLRGGLVDGSATALTARPVSFPRGAADALIGAAAGGGVWIGPGNGGLIRYRASGETTRWTVRDGLPAAPSWLAHEARDGAVWLALSPRGLGRIRQGRYAPVKVPGIAQPNVSSIVEDARGRLWVGVWDAAELLEFAGDSLLRVFGPQEGLLAPATSLTIGRGDTLWAATDSGLVRIVDGKLTLIRVPSVARAIRQRPDLVTTEHDLWMATDYGIARFPLAALSRAKNTATDTIPVRWLGPRDGVHTPRRAKFSAFSDFQARDGRAWFLTPGGLAVYDPRWEVVDTTAPIPHVESLSVGDSLLDLASPPEVPPHPDRITIVFSATAQSLPEQTRIQFRLDGVDQQWVDAEPSRVASFPGLAPGEYRFRVRAWNADGVASIADAVLTFRVLAAWNQGAWFRGLVLLAVGGIVALLTLMVQHSRSRRATELLTSQFDATLKERNRIAQELHDTLIQGFVGVTLQLRTAELALPTRPGDAAATLARVQGLADQTLREARESVWDLRSPELDSAELPEAVLARAHLLAGNPGPRVELRVLGARRRLTRRVEVTAFRIVGEAVANAVKHAAPQRIVICLEYSDHRLLLRIEDDGCGIDAAYAAAAGGRGHWGLVGMEERARRLGGQCTITPGDDRGTVVSAALPHEG